MALLLGLGKKLAKKATQGALESVAKKAPRMSEALNPHIGKRLYITQADRTALDYDQGLLGGPGFVDLAEIDPAKYKDAAWAVNKQQTASTLVNAMAQNPEEAIWTNLIGSPTQHRSNQIVFDRIMNQFNKAVQEDRLTPELRKTINNRLANMKDDKTGTYFFPKNVDILSPDFAEHAQTFDNRAMIAKILSGEGIKKDMKALYKQPGTIVDTYGDIIRDTSDPLLVDANTHDIGNRLFSLSGNIEENADLHPAFPFILKGRKESEAFTPAPKEIVLENYVNKYMQENKGKKPGTFSLTRGYPPSVEVDEPLVERLFKSGYAGGGIAKKIAKKIAKTLAKDYKPTKGKVSEVKDYIRDAKGEYGAQRVERAADLVPNLEKQYSARALREAFDGDNAKSVMVMNPADYEKYAKQLPEYYGKPMSGIKFTEGKQVPITIPPSESYYDILTGKNPLERSDYTSRKMILDDYLDYLGQTARGKGLLETPYLMLDESKGLKNFRIAGHEGRHRARALEKLGDESTLIRLLPRGIREGLPRSSQEEYQEGLKELLGPNPKVYPEKPYGDKYKENYRSLIELPEFFAEGGSVDKDPEQLRNIIKGILGSDIEKDQDFGAGGVVKNIAKKLAKDIELPPAENSARTQIVGTMPTYEKARDILGKEGIKGADILDFGAGKGLGSTAMKADSFEPYPQGWYPTYTKSEDIPSEKYKGLLNLNVLNVLDPEMRAHTVKEIGRVMRPEGGTGLITTRGRDVLNTVGGKAGNEPMSVITSRDTYQKGFEPEELREYIRYILGGDFEYEPLNLGQAGVKIKKKADGGSVEDDTRYITQDPTAYLLEEVKPVNTKLDAKEFKKRIGSGNLFGRITGDIVGGVKDIAEDTAQEVRRLKPRSIIDIPVNATAEAVGFPMDIAEELNDRVSPIRSDIIAPKNKYLMPIKPLPLTSESLKQGAKDLGITSGEQFPNLQFASQFALPSLGRLGVKGAKAYGNLVKEGIERNIGMIEPRMNIIKDPGGMLVGGERDLDEALLNMKKTENAYPHAQANFVTDQKDPNAVALNSWIDTKVRKYIRNQAGSEADPILKTIESGVEHNFQPAGGNTKYSQKIKRASVGKPEEGIAKTDLGKEWEYKVDSIFHPSSSAKVKAILNNPNIPDATKKSMLRMEHDLPIQTDADYEAIKLINDIPDKNVYDLNPTGLTQKLGLDHVSDVLYEDLVSGKLTSEQLNQMSIEKAIRRVAEYDAEKAKAMAKANASSVEGMPIPKQYDDGYKWVELKHDTDPKRTQVALKSEGEMMGHCVGGYCPEVESGEIKIYSLRGPDGKSHVTIEARPQFSMTLWRNANIDAINSNPKLKEYDFNMNSLDNDHKYGYRMTEQDYVREMTKEMKKLGINPVEPPSYMELHQVKGKQNKRPDDKYQSYISDFVKNNPTKHEIVSVEDLQNTNLMNVQDVVDDGVVGKNLHFHPDVEKIVKNYPKENLMAMYRKGNVSRSPMEVDEDIKYNIFKDAAKDLARQNKSFIDNDDILNHLREKYLTPPKKAEGGSIDLQQEYKLENMRRRYG